MKFKQFLQRITVGRVAIYRYDQRAVKFSPLLFVFIFLSLLLLTSSQSFIDTKLASAANGNIYPDSDTTTQFANSTGANHFGEIDEATLNTGGGADYINTGTGGNSGSSEVEEYTMTSVAGPNAPVTSVQVYVYAYAQGGCNSACDQLNVQISIDGGAFTAANSVTLTGTSTELAVTAFTGTWTGDDDVSVRITRGVNGNGNPNNQDDDVRIDRVRADITYTPVANLDQTHFRWRDDSAALNTNSGWLANEDVKPASADTSIGDILRLRTQVNNPSVTQGIQGFRLQWAVRGASCSVSTGWTRIDTASDDWELTASSQYANDDATTSNLLTAGTVFVNGAGLDTDSSGDDTSANIQLDQNDYTEVEWAIRATSNATGGESYCFRVVDSSGGVLTTYTNYPEVTLFAPIESLITQEAYIWEYDDGANVDSNSQQVAGNTAITSVKKGERLNLRAQLKNLGTASETDNLALFYDRGDNIWTKVESDIPNTGSGSGCTDTQWTCSTIDTGGTDNTGFYSRVAFDSKGTAWVAYVNATTGALEVATYVGTGGSGCGGTTEWNCQAVALAGGTQSSIAIDENDTVWVSFMYDGLTNEHLAVAEYVGSGGNCPGNALWNCTNIDTATDAGWYSDIAINPKTGNPWISYANATSAQAFEVAEYLGGATTGTGCAVNTWTCYTVLDDANDYGQEYTSIAFSGDGTAWASAHDDTNGDLIVAQYVGSSGSGCTSSAWTCTTVASANDSGDIGTAIAVDSSGNPAVVFREVSTGGDLVYAKYLGGATTGTGCAVNTWDCTVVDSTGDVGAYASIIIDTNGNPWISYRDTTNTNPKVARYLGGETTGSGCAVNTWTCTSVKTGGDNDGFFTSLASAPNGNIWMTFYESTGGDAEVAVLNRNAEIIPTSSLAASNGDTLSESHTDMTTTGDTTNRDDADCASATTWNNGLHSTTEELTGLSLPAGDSTTQCTEVSWTIDTSQAIEGETYRFVVASKDNWRADKGVWRGPIAITEYPTLTIEADTDLRAAKAVNPVFANCATDTSWGCQTIHTTNAVGNETYIKFSPEGIPWVSYQDTTANDLWVANYVGSGGNCDTLVAGSDAWQCTLIEATGTVSYFTSMSFDKEGKPWIAYTRGTTANLDLAVARFVGGASGTGCGGGSSDWSCESVAVTNNVGSYPSIAFDESGTAMIAYRDETGGDLEFARYVGSGGDCDTVAAGSDGWNCYTIDATNNVGYTNAMEVASDGTIWIAYQDFSSGAVNVAKYVGSGGNCDSTGGSDAWQCTKVDDRGANVLGYDIDIAIDSQGRPWIAHLDNTAADLELVRYVGGGTGNCNSVGTGSADWFCETIQATNNVGYTPGIAIDSNDTAWVSFGDNSTQRLRVAKYVGSAGSCAGLGGSGSWNCNEIQTASGYYSSIDIDPSGVPWISHTQFTFNNLEISKLDLPPSPLTANRGGPQIPSGDAKYRLDGIGYGDVATDDTALDAIAGSINDSLLFTFEKEGITSGSKPISITWTGQSSVSMATNNTLLQIYRYGTTNAWETLATESACAADTDCTIEASVLSNVGEYTNNGVVSVRVYQDEHTTAQILKTDFIDIVQPTSPYITQEAYIFENDDGSAADTNTQQVAGDTARTGVVKGERINLRAHIKNTGDAAPTDYALFYDKGDGLWSQVSNDKPVSSGSCDDTNFDCTVVAGTGLGEKTSIAYDPSGIPWIAYYDEVNQNLGVATYVGAGGNCSTVHASGSDAWNCEVVDATGDVGDYTSIAVDTNGIPWISYRDVGDLGVATYVGSGGNCDATGGSDAWQCTVVDATDNVGFFTNITVDASGIPWIAYQDATNYNLEAAKYVGSGGNCDDSGGSDAWQCTTVDVTGDVGWNASIAIDADGTAWISHADDTIIGNANLEVAKYVGSGGNCDSVGAGSDEWQCSTIETTDNIGWYSSLAIGPDGSPWISYNNSTDGDLKVAKFVSTSGNCENSTEWDCTVVDSTDDVGYYTGMAFDPSGNPIVTSFDVTNSNLDIALFVGSGGNCDTVGAGSDAWQCYTVLSTGAVGSRASIAISATGEISISHRDFSNTSVAIAKLATKAEITLSPSLAAANGDSLSESHADMTTTVDATNRDDADCITGAASWNNGLFSTAEEISQLVIPNGETTAQCTELNFTIDTSQAVEGETYRFVIATKDNWRADKGVWRGPIAITEYPTLTIEADTILRAAKDVSFQTGSDCTNANWSCETIDSTGDVGSNSRIELDNNDVPWVVYKDSTNNSLEVAQFVGSGGNCDTTGGGSDAWQCTSIDSPSAGGPTGGSGSLDIAFDSNNDPWITYTDGTNWNLLVANFVGGSSGTCDNTAWNCTTVDATDIVGYLNDIEFTSTGEMFVTYLDYTNAQLNYAQYVGSGGNCDTVGAGSDEWNCFAIEDIGASVDTTVASDLYIGKNDLPWALLTDPTGDDMHVYNYVGSGGNCALSAAWNCEVLENGLTDPSSVYPSIAVDDNGVPAVAYRDNVNLNVNYAQYVGTGGTGCASSAWTCTTIIDDAQDQATGLSLEFGPNNKPTIMYIPLSAAITHVATYVGSSGNCGGTGEWQCTSVYTPTNGTFQAKGSHVIDRHGNVWRAQIQDSTGSGNTVIVKSKYSIFPTTADRGSNGAPSGDALYRLDDNGYTNIALDDSLLDEIDGGANDSQYYTFEKTVPLNNKGIEITWVGQSSVSMATNNTKLQIYRYGSTNNWENLVTETSCSADTDCTIEATLGSGGEYSAPNGSGDYTVSVRVIQDEHTTTQTLRTDSLDVILIDGPQITQEGYIFENDDGVSADTSSAQVAGATVVSDVRKGETLNLRTQITNTGGAKPTNYSLFYDSGDGIWNRVYNTLENNPVGNCSGDNRFTCTTIDDPGTPFDISIAVNPTDGMPWISHYEGGGGNLEVAQYVGSGGNCSDTAWSCEIVDATGTVGIHSQIAFDSSGTAWISYHDLSAGPERDLKVARYVGSGGNCDLSGGSDAWECTLVLDTANEEGYEASIAFDSNGNPWISHYDVTSGDLEVAQYVGSGGNCDSVGSGSDAWNCITIDANGTVGGYTNISFDSEGTAWIVYDDFTNNTVKVAKYVGGGGNCDDTGGSDAWECTVVEADATSYVAIAVDAESLPWIAYRDSTTLDLKVAKYTGSGTETTCTGGSSDWDCDVVQVTDDVGGDVNITIDAAGNPWVGHYDATDADLEIAHYVGSGGNCDDIAAGSDAWNCSTVDSTNATGAHTSIAFDPGGKLWVAYKDSSNTDVDLAVIERQGEITLARSQSSSNGDALSESHADMTTVTDTTNRDDADCINGSAIWSNGVMSSGASLIENFATPDGSATPQCTELTWTIDTSQSVEGKTYRFMVATDDGPRPDKGIWRGAIQVNEYPTLTIKTDTDIRYSKTTTQRGSLCDSYDTGSAGSSDWNCRVIDDQTDVLGNNQMSIAIDMDETPWVSYNNGSDGDLVVAKYVGSGGNCDTYAAGSTGSDAWECTLIAVSINAGGSPDINFDNSGNAWIASNAEASLFLSRYVGSGGNCDDLYSGSDEWNCEYIDRQNASGSQSSLRFTSSGQAWISYRYSTSNDLKIAKYVGSGGNCDDLYSGSDEWECTVVDATNSVGDYSMLTIDTNDIPWISYQDATNNSSKVARYVGSGGNCDNTGGSDAWECTVVDNQTDNVGLDTTITTNADGTITMAYQNQTDQSLVAAEYVGSGGNCDTYATGSSGSDAWECTVVDDQTTGVAFDVSMASGPGDEKYIIYQGEGGGNVLFARYVGTGGNCDTYAAGSTGSDAWECTVVDDAAAGKGDFPDVAVDNSGIPWLVYQDWSDASIIVAKANTPLGPLGANRGNNSIPSGDLNFKISDGRSPRSGLPGDCGTSLAAMMGYCGMFDNQGDYDSITALEGSTPIYAGATKFDTNTELPTITWEGRSSSAPSNLGPLGDIVLQVYRFGSTNAWETIATDDTSVNCDTQDCTVSGSATDTVSEYFEADGSQYWAYFRVYQINSSSSPLDFKVDKFSAQITDQRLRGGRIFEDGVRKPLLTE